MFWFFGKLKSLIARAIFHVSVWIVIPGVVLLLCLCLFRVRLPDQRPDNSSCLDQVAPKPDTEDAVALQDEMSGVRR